MDSQSLNNNSRWYAICTHPRQEDRASQNLMAWGITTFLPKVKDARSNPFNGRREYAIKPLFPRYLFAKFEIESGIHKVKFTRGVYSLVGGKNPLPVQEEVIGTIKERIDQSGYVKIGEELEKGDKVRITDGALKNFIGVFEHTLQDEDRIRILLTTISYQGHIEIERSLVCKV